MNRFAIATLAVTLASLLGIVHADAPKPTVETAAAPAKPDPIADVEGSEANLEPQEPRKGLTFSAAFGGGITLGGGVGRGPTVSLRLGHVATRKTIITFELVRIDSYHRAGTDGPTLSDVNYGLFVGAQRYTSRSLWVRTSGGFAPFVKNANVDGTGGETPRLGVGGLVGIGLDLARARTRLGYFVLGLEATGMGSISGEGLRAGLAFSPLCLSLY